MKYIIYTFNGFHSDGERGLLESHHFNTESERKAFIKGIEYAGERSDISHSKNLKNMMEKEIYSYLIDLEGEDLREIIEDYGSLIEALNLEFSMSKNELDKVEDLLRKEFVK